MLRHARILDVLCLSTNAVHVGAYDALAAMAPSSATTRRRTPRRPRPLRAAIESTFRDEDQQRYAYLVEPATGARVLHEEEFGVALAVLLDVTPPEQAARLVASAHRSPHGVVNLWPHFDGYDDTHPARHNAMCWPMVMGVWAWAVAATGQAELFGQDLEHLVGLLASSDGQYELYDPQSGEPHGGWQALRVWASEPDQTWSSTALVATVVLGLLGLRATPGGVRFAPTVLPHLSGTRLRGLPYRGAVLDVSVSGSGAVLDEVIVDGVPKVAVDAPVHVPIAMRHGAGPGGAPMRRDQECPHDHRVRRPQPRCGRRAARRRAGAVRRRPAGGRATFGRGAGDHARHGRALLDDRPCARRP